MVEDHLVAVISVKQVCFRLLDHHFHCHFAHFRCLPAAVAAIIRFSLSKDSRIRIIIHQPVFGLLNIQFISVSEVRWNIVPIPFSVKNSKSML